jgi:hypothetical protein
MGIFIIQGRYFNLGFLCQNQEGWKKEKKGYKTKTNSFHELRFGLSILNLYPSPLTWIRGKPGL